MKTNFDSRTSKLKILFITPTIPWPMNNGSRLRIAHFLDHLSKNNSVELIMIATPGENVFIPEEINNRLYGRTIIRHAMNKSINIFRWLSTGKPYRNARIQGSGLGRILLEKIEKCKYDVIWCNFMEVLEYLPEKWSASSERPLVILDQHNSDSLWFKSFSSSSSLKHRLFGLENIRRLKQYEPISYKKIDLCLCVSDQDLAFSRTLNPEASCILNPSGVSVEDLAISPEKKKSNSVLFVGSLDVTMNQQAIKWFIQKIWPLLKSKIPDATFCIVGRNPPDWIKNLGNTEGITVHGNVPSVASYYSMASAFAAPFELGGGMKLKILEAFAAKVPVVTTTIGVSGLPVIHKMHAIVEDDPSQFAFALANQMKEPDHGMIQRAYDLANTRFKWSNLAAEAEQIARECLTNKLNRQNVSNAHSSQTS